MSNTKAVDHGDGTVTVDRAHLLRLIDAAAMACDPSSVITIIDKCKNAEAARDRTIRALRRMVDERISTNKDRDAWRCWSNACDGDHLAPTREAIVHQPDCPVPDAEVVLREADENAVQ